MAKSSNVNCSSCTSSGVSSSSTVTNPASSSSSSSSATYNPSSYSVSSATPVSQAECCNTGTVETSCNFISCEQEHAQVIVEKEYSTTIKIENAFNMPAADATVELVTRSVSNVLSGSILYNPQVGYLVVDFFDPSTGKIFARNSSDFVSCNVKAAGEPLSSCIEFLVSAPSCGSSTTNGSSLVQPFLDCDFTVPSSGSAVPIKVTNTNGITINSTVSINSYIYRVSNIIDATTIEITNDGQGGALGFSIKADGDNDGNLDIPVIVVAEDNPCTRDSVSSGVLLACKDGIERPLVGNASGQVPVWNPTTSEWDPTTVAFPDSVCTDLTGCLILDSANVEDDGSPGSYVLLVADSSVFTEGVAKFNPYLLEIVDTTGVTREFELVSILGANSIRIRPTFTVASSINVTGDCTTTQQVCEADCCTQIFEQCLTQAEFGQALEGQNSLGNVNLFDLSGGVSNHYVVPTPLASFSYTNTSTCNKLIQLEVNIIGTVGHLTNDETLNQGTLIDLHLETTGNVNGRHPRATMYFPDTEMIPFSTQSPDGFIQNINVSVPALEFLPWHSTTIVEHLTVAPGDTVTADLRTRLSQFQSGGVSTTELFSYGVFSSGHYLAFNV